MSVKRNTPGLDSLLHMMQQLESGAFTVEAPVPESEQIKVKYGLVALGRPLLKQTRGIALAFNRYAKVELDKQTRAGRFDADALVAAGSEGIKQHVLLRLREGGNDVDFRALKPATVERKIARGAQFPSSPGRDTGDLYSALSTARWTVRRGG